MDLQDASGSQIETSATAVNGTYIFNTPAPITGRVVLIPTDSGRGQEIFQVYAQQAPVALARQLNSVPVDGAICDVSFDLWNADISFTAIDSSLERWPSIMEMYQNFNNAAELAMQLDAPLDYSLPVRIYAWCDSSDLFCDPTGKAEFAFYSGSTPGRTVEQPYIALGFPTSELNYRGVPDNREYHEFGHAFFADAIGNEVPVQVGDANHGGYYRNQMTTDSLVEGFAEFYSVIVTKYIEQADNPQRYKIGAEYDIEVDRKPSEAVGWWEEFTLAGLLLDFEDGSGDYAQPVAQLDVEAVSMLNTDTGDFAIGRVRNSGSKVVHDPEVTVTLTDGAGNVTFTQVTSVKPQSLGPGQTGVFYVAAPDGVQFDAVTATAGRPAGVDDDAIDVELADLMQVVTSNWGEGATSITTIKELYAALSDAFVGKDLNGDGVIDATQAQVDDIFVKHGFFDDIDGDKQFNQAFDGDIGGSAHPAATVSKKQFQAIIPRSSAVGFDGSYVAIDTAGVDAELLVQVEVPGDSGVESYAYWTSAGTNEPVELAVPAANGDQAAVTVIAAAGGHNPAVAYRITAEQFNAAVDSGEIQSEPARARIEMSVGDPLAILNDGGSGNGDGGGNNSTPPWTMILPILLAGIMLGGGIYFMRRNPATP